MAIRILKQKIRNIASIVAADIDYEKELVDLGTNNPSSNFLIYGDTGAGKTAIIDALTLALYKTTPRLNNVANRTNNSFHDKNGNEIKVFGISQYSRIGISSKDECYSEVEFVDRQGRTCIARLELGYTSKGSYRTPVWSYLVDGKTYTKDADINEVIKETIGISYDQYKHTSLLAQGRFDAFLTGGKDERKLILEQLTDTARFTRMGEGITLIYKRYKHDRDMAGSAAASIKNSLLTDDIVSELQSQDESLSEEIKQLKKAILEDETKRNNIAQTLKALDQAARDIASSNQAIAREESRFDLLNGDLMFKKSELESHDYVAANEALQAARSAVEELDRQKEALRPAEISEEITRANTAMNQLVTLRKEVGDNNELFKSLNEKHKLLLTLYDEIIALNDQCTEAENRYKEVWIAADSTNRIYGDMMLSKDEALEKMRAKLALDHAETCPLCGSRVESWAVDMEKMLAPLIEQKAASDKALAEADTLRKDVITKRGVKNGEYQRLTKEYNDSKAIYDTARQNIAAAARALSFDAAAEMLPQIAVAIYNVSEQISKLNDKNQKVRELDILLKQANTKLFDAQKALADADTLSALVDRIEMTKSQILQAYPNYTHEPQAKQYRSANVEAEWNNLSHLISSNIAIINRSLAIQKQLKTSDFDKEEPLEDIDKRLCGNKSVCDEKTQQLGVVRGRLESDRQNHTLYTKADSDLQKKKTLFEKWERLNGVFGGNKLCLLVQSYIMRPLLNNANLYLERITDRYRLTFSSENEQLSILVLDKYNQNQIRSATVLSGGERFMISLSLSLALSALSTSDSNFNVLFIDEGFGTLDEKNLDSVMKTLEMLPQITGQTDRRVGIISHIEELVERIPTQIHVTRQGDGRSEVKIIRR